MPKKVLINGCWDPWHYGHHIHALQAKEIGGKDCELWCSVTDDANVLKGAGRPIFKQEQRLAVVKSIRIIDKAFTCASLIEALDFAKPDILIKGIDYRDGLHEVHENYCKKRGIEIRYTTTPKLSAAEMIKAALESKRH